MKPSILDGRKSAAAGAGPAGAGGGDFGPQLRLQLTRSALNRTGRAADEEDDDEEIDPLMSAARTGRITRNGAPSRAPRRTELRCQKRDR